MEMVLNAEHKIQGEELDKIQLLPPFIYLNLPVSTPWSLNPPLNLPISTPKPTNLHPLYKIRLLPSDLVYCIEVLLQSNAMFA